MFCSDLNLNSWFWHRQVRYDLCCLEYCSLVSRLETDAVVNPETDRYSKYLESLSY